MTVGDELVASNERYAASFDSAGLPSPPAKKLVVLTCMDARIDPNRLLGLALGDAHVIRNAGGVASQDALRSLVVSQQMLGTEEIVILHHRGCGMERLDESALKDKLESETGVRPSFSFESFNDVAEDVRQTAARIRACPFVASGSMRGFLYDVNSGRLAEIDLDSEADRSS